MAFPKEPKTVTEKFGFVGGNALQAILDKLPDAITEGEREILRDRRSYLTEEQIKRFGLEEKEIPKGEITPPAPPVEPPIETKAKKSRKLKK